MVDVFRRSSISLGSRPRETEVRDGWEVILEYEEEGRGPLLIDLSHKAKWDVQDADLSRFQPWGVPVPSIPGQCIFRNGILISRMNRTQAACWHLRGEPLSSPQERAYTDTTDASVLLALLGREIFFMMEKTCSLDFHSRRKETPCLFQAPVLHVTSQVVFMGEKDGIFGVLLSCARGYGNTMVEGLLRAGDEWGLLPAGERAFSNWIMQASA